jgi:hypothetical protein
LHYFIIIGVICRFSVLSCLCFCNFLHAPKLCICRLIFNFSCWFFKKIERGTLAMLNNDNVGGARWIDSAPTSHGSSTTPKPPKSSMLCL